MQIAEYNTAFFFSSHQREASFHLVVKSMSPGEEHLNFTDNHGLLKGQLYFLLIHLFYFAMIFPFEDRVLKIQITMIVDSSYHHGR